MRTFACALGALVAIAATPAAAVTLALGDTPLPGTNIFARPELDGLVLADRRIDYELTFDGHLLKGQVQQTVLRSTSDGTLDFTWRILPDADSELFVTALRLGGFGDFITDGDWRSDSLGDVAPTLARKFDGGFVNFIFDDAVGSEQSSYIFFLKTTATRYASRGFFDVVCDGGAGCISPTGPAYAPVATPEPGTWAVMILGFGLAGAVLRRRAVSA